MTSVVIIVVFTHTRNQEYNTVATVYVEIIKDCKIRYFAVSLLSAKF